MTIAFKWVFPDFEVIKAEDGLTDVVKAINWRYVATSDKMGPYGFNYTADICGRAELGPPNPQDFIPYEDLTEQWAIDVVSAQVDVPTMTLNLEEEIAAQENPPIVPLPPPFPQ